MPEQAVAADLIAQRGTARMVDTVLETFADGLVCRGRVSARGPFASADGRVPAVAALELAAQATAVHQALGASGASVTHGYLVAVRSAILHADDVEAGVPLMATVRRAAEKGPLATYDVAVAGPAGETILTATLSTHRGA
ncbi:MAG TPA: hypothetical protein VGQ33_00760 [Vicinamibacteria bacterium]|nr:hypothetical protein [Vicinamibacteria bacterium]